MDWQQPVALGIVAATAAGFLWRRIRPAKFDFQRDTHCGCSSPANTASKSSIVFRARKGERPQIVVKMN
jgi:hypothetical protein